MTKIDKTKLTPRVGSSYPAPHDAPCKNREALLLGIAGGLTQFGVNEVTLPSGAWSSQRHWHSHEDEFIYVLKGELILVTDEGETTLCPGDCAAFPAGVKNGHHLQNRSRSDAVFLAIGTRDDRDHGEYSDIDMKFTVGRYGKADSKDTFTHKDGTPYSHT